MVTFTQLTKHRGEKEKEKGKAEMMIWMEIGKTKGMIKAIDRIVVKKFCTYQKQKSRLRSAQLYQNSKAFVEEN